MSPLALAPLQQRTSQVHPRVGATALLQSAPSWTGGAKCTKSWGNSTAAKCAKLDCWTPLYYKEGEQSANGIESLSVTLKITASSPQNVESNQMWCLGLVVGPEKLSVSVWPPQREIPTSAYRFSYVRKQIRLGLSDAAKLKQGSMNVDTAGLDRRPAPNLCCGIER